MKQNPSLDINVKNTLKEILRNMGISEELLQDNALLHRDLELDSTEIVEISLAVKRQFGIAVKLETYQDKTLAQVSHVIQKASSNIREVGQQVK